MNKKLNKFLVLLLVLSTIISWSAPSLAANAVNMPYVIHETVESEYLGSGIKYENVKKFTSKGWWNINVVRVDLTDEYAEVGGLMSSKGFSDRQPVSKLVKENNAVAGVNGDFFSFKTSSPFGAFIDKGEVKAAPINANEPYPTFYLDSNNNAGIDIFTRTMAVKSLRSGKQAVIQNINKPVGEYNFITLYNKNYGTHSIGNKYHDDLVEMVVVNDVVQEIRIGQEPIPMPQDGYIIAIRGGAKIHILNNFQVGDPVELNVSTTPNYENIKFAIGGGHIVLKDGIPTNSNPGLNVNGDQPRTGVGITQDGKELIIATIDGRHANFKGVGLEVFGAIFKDLGAYNAINLDGGGSTTMAIKPIGEQVKLANIPSDGAERRVPNGVGVYSNAPKGELSYIKVATDDTNMFVNTSRKFNIKGYDQYHNPVEVDQNAVVYSVEGIEGEINGNVLKANSSGIGNVTADYNGLTDSMSVKVLDQVQSITLPVDRFNLNTNDKKSIGGFYGKDKNGFEAKIYPEDVNYSVTNNLGYVENNVFYSKDKIGAGAITVSVGNAINNILVSIGSEKNVVENFENLNNLSFTSYPNYVKGSLGLSQDAIIGNHSGQIKYDFSGGNVTRAAYMNFKSNGNNGLAIAGTPVRLGLWVKGDGQGSWLRGSIKDKNGKEYLIDFVKSLNSTDWEYAEANIPSNIAYPITLEKIYVVETNGNKKHSGEVLIDGLTGVYPTKYDNTGLPKATSFKDNKNTKSEKTADGFSFIVTKAPNDLDTVAGFNATTTIQNRANSHDVSLFMGGVSTEFMKGVESQLAMNTGINFVTKRHKNVMFIDANNSKGGLRPVNPEQWKWLKRNLENPAEDHIVLILPKPVFGSGGFTDPLEADLLHQVLVEAGETGKTIWVIHGGNSNKTELKEGVRYIQYDNRPVTDANGVKSINAIEFVVNGKNITYQINPIFK